MKHVIPFPSRDAGPSHVALVHFDAKEHAYWPSGFVVWYGGPLRVVANGKFGGATVSLVMNLNAPMDGDMDSYADPLKHPDGEWVELCKFTGNGQSFHVDNLNPCALALRCTGVKDSGTNVGLAIHRRNKSAA